MARAERAIRDLLRALGVEDDATRTTARTAAHALADVLLAGYRDRPEAALGGGFPVSSPVPVIATRIPILFMCPHHLLPAQGEAHVAFVPKDRVPGLARIARLVDVLSRRLVLQEDLTASIARAFVDHLSAPAAVAIVEARHTCVAVDDFARRGTIFRTRAAVGAKALIASLESEIDASLCSPWATHASKPQSAAPASRSPSSKRRSSPATPKKRTSSQPRRRSRSGGSSPPRR